MKIWIAAFLFLLSTDAFAQWQTPNHSVPIGRGAGVTGFRSVIPGTAGLPLISQGPTLDPTFGAALSIAATGQWFSQNGMATIRLNDNVLIGGATVSDMAFPNVTKDWLSTFQTAAGLSFGSIPLAELGVLTQNSSASASGAAAIVGGAQSLFSIAAGTSSIGVGGYAVNNNATLATSAWGLYSECHKTTAAALSCYGLEVDPRSTIATITPTPFQQGDIIGMQVACGAGLAATQDCSAGLQYAANPNKYKKGIVFGSTSLTASGGGGAGIAIDSARGHTFRWSNNGPGTDAEIWGDATGLHFATTGGVDLLAAWAVFTASPSCGTATITTNSARSKTFGKTTFIEADLTVTVIGTCAAVLTFTLPNTAASPATISGVNTATNLIDVCTVTTASATATCFQNGGITFLVNARLLISGVYENQ